MDVPSAPVVSTTPPLYPVPYLWFILLLALAIGIYVVIERYADFANMQANWAEYRCQPQVMPFAGLFGYDINENFQFCVQQIIQEKAKGVTGPFAQGMFGFTGILTNLMNSANSFRTMLATLVGGVIKIVSEFKARMTALMGRVKLTASRMKAMMYRVYGTMFAVVYMGLSAQTALSNFGDTFIFKFIDTFCFPPEQPIQMGDGSMKPISEVKVNDILVTGNTVTTIYKFACDGQEMVDIRGVQVSSNHFIRFMDQWIMAKEHPSARLIEPWNGANERPLICLSTSDHKIQIANYIFADYDETEKGNAQTQAWVNAALNGLPPDTPYDEVSYEVGAAVDRRIRTLNGMKSLAEIKLGDKITERDRVVGIQESVLTEFCVLPGEHYVAAGTLLWESKAAQWIRACVLYATVTTAPRKVIALFVSPGASYEFEGGVIVRDAMEVYSPDTKKAYADALLSEVSSTAT